MAAQCRRKVYLSGVRVAVWVIQVCNSMCGLPGEIRRLLCNTVRCYPRCYPPPSGSWRYGADRTGLFSAFGRCDTVVRGKPLRTGGAFNREGYASDRGGALPSHGLPLRYWQYRSTFRIGFGALAMKFHHKGNPSGRWRCNVIARVALCAKVEYGHWQCDATVRMSFRTRAMQRHRKGVLLLGAYGGAILPQEFPFVQKWCNANVMVTLRVMTV